MIKMIVIDDEYLVRRGIKETIDWQKYNIEIIGEADNGKKGLKLIKELNPDIVISDIKMPVMDGVELVKNIQKERLDVGIIILSGYKDFDFAKKALEGGAFEYLLKPIENQELITSVLRAIDNTEKQRTLNSKANIFDEQKSLIENSLVMDLLTNNYQDYQRISEKLNQLNSPIPKSGFLVVINIDDSEFEDITDNLISFTNEYLRGLYQLNNSYYLNHFNQDIVIMIDTNKESLKEYFASVIDRFEETENQSLSIGISNHYQDNFDLHDRFEEAKKALESKLYIGFSHLLFFEDKTIDLKPIVRDVMDYIAKNYANNISVKSAAEALFVSESYLLHQFKEHSNKTFNDCLSKHRVLMAKKKLLDHDKRIYEVASEVGYQDVKYFSQIFKKRVGMTPSEFRKSKGIKE
jgi:two-component system response regulator YesN